MCTNMAIGGFAGLLFTLALLALLIGASVLVWRRIAHAKVPSIEATSTPAMAVLRQRYAQGEISTEEYSERSSFLGS
jgi:uncharacterized membrane protein